MRKITSREVSISAVSAALATMALTLGTLYSPFLFTGYLVACVALMLPLSERYYAGCALAYVATGLLTLTFNGFNFWDTMPFILFFGLHPLVNALQKKWKINRFVALVPKAAWFDGAMYLTWRFVFSMNTAIPFVDRYILPIILIGGTLFFVFYDYATIRCQEAVNVTVDRIVRGGKK